MISFFLLYPFPSVNSMVIKFGIARVMITTDGPGLNSWQGQVVTRCVFPRGKVTSSTSSVKN